MKIFCSPVVAEARPSADHITKLSFCKNVHRGKLFQKFSILLPHSLYLCLLQHDLRDKNTIGVAGVSPRHLAVMRLVPAKEHLIKMFFLLSYSHPSILTYKKTPDNVGCVSISFYRSPP